METDNLIFLKDFCIATNKPYLSIFFDKKKNIIIEIWKGAFGSQENLKECLLFISDQIKEKKISKWFSDLQNLEGSFDSSREWISGVLIPQTIKNGMKQMAMVLPRDIFSKLSLHDTTQKVGGFELRQFNNAKEAEEWIYNSKI